MARKTGTAQSVKMAAKSRSIPVVFAKRSWRAVEEKLKANKCIANCVAAGV